MVDPLFVSFYTDSYAEKAKGLESDFKLYGLDYRLIRRTDRGSYMRNINQKPEFIAQMRRDHPGRQWPR